MDSDQTGFSSSSPPSSVVVASAGHSTSSGSSSGEEGTNRVTPPTTPGVNRSVLQVVKEEPDDEVPVGALPSISEENWRAYYQQPLVAVMNGNDDHSVSAIYETYRLPPLTKFGKGFVGKFPTIWSVAVTSPDGSALLSVGDDPTTTPNSSPCSPSQPSDLSSTTLYLRTAEKVERDDVRSVIQAVPEDLEVVKTNGAEEKESVVQALPLAPAAVEVKQPDSENGTELGPDSVSSRDMQAEGSQADLPMEGATYPPAEFSPSPYEPLGTGQYSVLTNVVVTAAPPQYAAHTSTGVYTLTTGDYYREFYAPAVTSVVSTDQYQQQAQPQQQQVTIVRQQLPAAASTATFSEGVDANTAYVERYIRQNYKPSQHGLTVDLPSPDSGIGETTVTPRDSLQQIFDYTDLAHPPPLIPATEDQTSQGTATSTASTTPVPLSPPPRKTSWSQEYGRNAEADKVQIPKVFSEVGFHYYLESPISTSQRREDDRMTYINKGQYYGITLEYIPDPDRPLRTCTVKSIVMLVFREEKSPEDELKAWKFWHGRQHSVKQRILDADTKNSCGIIGQIEEVTHNAIAFYWNPMEGPAKISISVHCLSTDFSNQKGVKGLPLHVQVDTLDDFREGAMPVHRGYCQIKVFCDKGAERKTRDEERRATKRKLTATGNYVPICGPKMESAIIEGGRKKIEEMYHQPCERSEFYSMSDLSKPPVLFTPVEDTEKPTGPELTYYTIAAAPTEDPIPIVEADVKPPVEISLAKKIKLISTERVSYWDSVLLYAKRADEEVFHPLHLVPPSLGGLAKAIESKYSIRSDLIKNLYKRCKKGITVEMDDDIVRHYCNEDTFIIDIIKTEDEKYNITLVEL